MRPLSDVWAKPVLPIDGRPVVGTLVRELAAAGFRLVTVVVGPHGSQIVELLGDGTSFGVELRYAEQPEPLGSADAVRRALSAGAQTPALVVGADMVFTPGDLGRVVREWSGSGAGGGLGVRSIPAEELGHQTPVTVESGRVHDLGGAPRETEAGVLTGAPVWFLGEEVAALLDGLPGPPYELGSAFQEALRRQIEIVALGLGPTRDVTRPEDVLRRNFPYLSRWGRGETGGA